MLFFETLLLSIFGSFIVFICYTSDFCIGYLISPQLIKRPQYINNFREKRSLSSENEFYEMHVHSVTFADNHTQFYIHWEGRGSPNIIGLGRDYSINPITSFSTLFVSYDYGISFTKKYLYIRKSNFTQTQIVASLNTFYALKYRIGSYVFVDKSHKHLFFTSDSARTFHSQKLDFIPHILQICPCSEKIYPFVWLGFDQSSRKLYISEDYCRTWSLLHDNVVKFFWGTHFLDKRKNINDLFLLVKNMYRNDNKVVRVQFTSNSLSPSFDQLIDGALDLHMNEEYIIVRRMVVGGKFEILVSKDRGKFQLAEFDGKFVADDIYAADWSEDMIFLVVRNGTQSNLYVSDTQGIRFSLSLADIIYFNPFLRGDRETDSLFVRKGVTTKQVELFPVGSLRGIYLANVVDRTLGAGRRYATRISFNKGSSWSALTAPRVDRFGRSTYCFENCTLFLAGAITDGWGVEQPYSSENAVGLIMASGTYSQAGKVKSDQRSNLTFVSNDAGISFREAFSGHYFYAAGDHGGVLIAVEKYRATRFLHYSLDEGRTWLTGRFISNNAKPLHVFGVLTEPGSRTAVFSVFGSDDLLRYVWQIFQINMTSLLGPTCRAEDYKNWTLRSLETKYFSEILGDTVSDLERCVLGRQVVYQRRKPQSHCFNGLDFQRVISHASCQCLPSDFECDDCYRRNIFTGKCELVCANFKDFRPPLSCQTNFTYIQPTGYRRVPNDSCVGGLERDFLRNVSCPISMHQGWLVIINSQFYFHSSNIRLDASPDLYWIRDRHLAFDVIPLWLPDVTDGISAVEFRLDSQCVYYCDKAAVKEFCFQSGFTRHLVKMSFCSALRLELRSQTMYVLNSQDLTLEVISLRDGHRLTLSSLSNSAHASHSVMAKDMALEVDSLKGFAVFSFHANSSEQGESARCDLRRIRLDGTDATILLPWNATGQQLRFIRLFSGDGLVVHFCDRESGARMLAYVPNWTGSVQNVKLNTRMQPLALITEETSIYSCRYSAVQLVSDERQFDLLHLIIALRHNWAVMSYRLNLAASKDELLFTAVDKSTFSVRSGVPLLSRFSVVDLRTYGAASQSSINSASIAPCGLNMSGQICVVGSGGSAFKSLCMDGFKTNADGSCSCPGGRLLERDGQSFCSVPVGAFCPQKEHFRCYKSGACLLPQRRCNGISDCPNDQDGTSDLSDEHSSTCRNHSLCNANEFRCPLNSKCIPLTWICDGYADCSSGIDEHDCKNYSKCNEMDHFQCGNTSVCINRHDDVCDGIVDCPDNEDEANCFVNNTANNSNNRSHSAATAYNCTNPNYFFCETSELCVFRSMRCNSVVDCPNSEDEWNCSPSCVVGQFRCRDLVNCVAGVARCNGRFDCADGSDEVNCNTVTMPPASTSSTNCSFGYFTCNARMCILNSQVCDGINDCGNFADESSDLCDNNAASSARCLAWQFQCPSDGFCLDGAKVCDNNVDCPADGGDEEPNVCSKIKTDVPKLIDCRPSEFLCSNGRNCISRSWLCDNSSDCSHNEDEINCAADHNYCEPNRFARCESSAECIARHRLCDGKIDCADGSDENGRLHPCSANSTIAHQLSEQVILPGEEDISSGLQLCANYEFQCVNDATLVNIGKNPCVASSARCDSIPQCADKSDETFCDVSLELRLRSQSDSLEWPALPLLARTWFKKYKMQPLYQYYLRRTDEFKWTKVVNVSGFHTKDTLPFLTPGVRYVVGLQLLALSSRGILISIATSLPTQNIYFTAPVRPPSIPLHIVVMGLPNGAVQLSWMRPHSDGGSEITKYRIEYHCERHATSRCFDTSTSSVIVDAATMTQSPLNGRLSYIIFNIQEKTSYLFALFAYNSQFWSESSINVRFKALLTTMNTFVPAPKFIKYHNLSLDTELFLQITFPKEFNVLAGHYVAPDLCAERATHFSIPLTQSRNQMQDRTVLHNFKSLVPGTVYNFVFRMCAQPDEETACSLTLFDSTATTGHRAPQVPRIRAELVASNDARIELATPAGAFNNWLYRVYYSVSIQKLNCNVLDPDEVDSIQLSARQVANGGTILRGLNPCRRYYFRAQVFQPNGPGQLSTSIATLRTDYSSNAPPQHLYLHYPYSGNHKEVGVFWTAPCPILELSVGYRIHFTELSTQLTYIIFIGPTVQNQLFKLVSDLIPGTTYRVQVFSDVPQSLPTRPQVFSTDAMFPPDDFRIVVTEMLPGQVDLDWTGEIAENNVVSGALYEVWSCSDRAVSCLSFTKDSFSQHVVKLPASAILLHQTTKANITRISLHLTPGHSYTFWLRARLPTNQTSKFSAPKTVFLLVPASENADAGNSKSYLYTSRWIIIAVTLSVLFCFACSLLAIYCTRYRRLQRSFLNFANSHYDIRSGRATIALPEDHELDEEEPIIRGFTDNEDDILLIG